MANIELLVHENAQRFFPYRLHEYEAGIVAAFQLQKLLGFMSGLKQPLAMMKRHDIILRAMRDKNRAMNRLQGL